MVYIPEALRNTSRMKPYITRKSWAYPTENPTSAAIKILPTNSPDCCVIMSVSRGIPCRGWEPTAGDLMADDWEPVGL